jgi:hypothetical protein
MGEKPKKKAKHEVLQLNLNSIVAVPGQDSYAESLQKHSMIRHLGRWVFTSHFRRECIMHHLNTWSK